MIVILRTLLIILFLIACPSRARDFYKILGVPYGAPESQIKKAYRKLSLKYHPDKCKEDKEKCKKRFNDVNSAHEVLGDKKKRESYDRVGRDEKQYKQWSQAGGASGAEGFNIFDMFGFGGQQGGPGGESEKSVATKMLLDVYLSALYLGDFVEIKFYRDVLCSRLDECESKDKGCTRGGVRKKKMQLAPGFVQQVEQPDPRCVAKGKRYKKDCKACPGGPTVEDVVPVSVDINPGMKHGQEIVIENIGNESMGKSAGDLIIKIQQIPHEYFVRDGDDLRLKLGITLKQALTGFEIIVKHLDDHDVVIKSTKVINCDTLKVIKGEGMPTESGGFGNLLVTFDIQFPKRNFSVEETEKLASVLDA